MKGKRPERLVVESHTEDCNVDGHCFHFVGVQKSILLDDVWSSKHVCCFCGMEKYLVRQLGDGKHGAYVEQAQHEPGSYFAHYDWVGERDFREGARTAGVGSLPGSITNEVEYNVAVSALEKWLR